MSKLSHGGAREGAGAKKKPVKKEPWSGRLHPEEHKKLRALSREYGHSQAAIIGYALRQIKELPEKL